VLVGARAWEQFDSGEGCVTVKRVVDSDAKASEREDTKEGQEEGGEEDEVKGKEVTERSWGVKPRKGRRDERRVITAIFADGSQDDGGDVNGDMHERTGVDFGEEGSHQGDEGRGQERETTTTGSAFESIGIASGLVGLNDGTHSAEDDTTLREIIPGDSERSTVQGLEAELRDTRALLDMFRDRLEKMERKVDQMAEEDARKKKARLEVGKAEEEGDVVSRKATGRNSTTLFSRILDCIFPSTPRRKQSLSSYVLLVGIGVCAIVLSAFSRRVGRK